MILIDMHVHSTYSDGTKSAEEIVRCAKRRHLSLISLTDHDTTAGLAPFAASCRANNISGLCGIELSAEADYTLHILGYRIPPSGAFELEKALAKIRTHRDERNTEICSKLRKLGLDIEIEEVQALSRGEVVARPHIARLMVTKGYVRSNAEAFCKYLGMGAAAYVPRVRLSAEESIHLISESGGLAALAHPAQTRLDSTSLELLIKKLKDFGLWGMESIYSGHSPEQIYSFLSLADKYGLFPTAGSDFHGANSPGIELGLPVSEDFLPWARLGIKI